MNQDNEGGMPIFETLKKFKRLRFLEPSLGVLGFSAVTAFIICCFFYLDYRDFGAPRLGLSDSGPPQRFSWLQMRETEDEQQNRVDFLGEEGGDCDVFNGKWVWDESYPLYQSKDCSLLDEGFRCSENGRPDLFYTKWRWQPKDCNLPRYVTYQVMTFSSLSLFSFHLSALIVTINYWVSWFLAA